MLLMLGICCAVRAADTNTNILSIYLVDDSASFRRAKAEVEKRWRPRPRNAPCAWGVFLKRFWRRFHDQFVH